ncbi:MAPEG family protein [Dokdonella immobilis]|uniref:MAPEG family protein n=1 Tax=Dokdonella immobilis TaxID=578942 RepID=A0A1I4YB83_9GAMM|nr:MAPEG family protein [Dokdonella immobilis]SFN35317.1 MAPEG family protein [Dokdonella immobilis]
MALVNLLLILAVAQFIVFAMLVASARGRYGVSAPATTGHEMFERYYRIHMNTLEMLIVLIPAVWIASTYWNAYFVATMIAIYLVGRILYFRAYLANPKSRTIGFSVSFLPILALLLAGAGGAIWSMLQTGI